MVGREVEHVGQVRAYDFRIGAGMQFVGEGNDGIAVTDGQFPEFEGVVLLDGLAVGHGFCFCLSKSDDDANR